jgi:hypothetical protein
MYGHERRRLFDPSSSHRAFYPRARVQAVAQPGEVLASRTVKDLVAGSGIGFTDRGTHRLKGLPDEWQLFARGCLRLEPT